MSYLQDVLGDAYKDGMTVDEISSALEKAGVGKKPAKSDDTTHLKEMLSKANSEAADYKKQLRAKQTEAEKAEADRKEAEEKLQKENADLKKKIAISENTSKYQGLGYSADLALSTANALFNGDMDTVIKNEQQFMADREKTLKAEMLKGTMRPEGGSGNTKMTKEEIMKISDPTERQAKIAENHELFGF